MPNSVDVESSGKQNRKYHRKQRSALPCQDGNEGERSRVHVLVDEMQKYARYVSLNNNKLTSAVLDALFSWWAVQKLEYEVVFAGLPAL